MLPSGQSPNKFYRAHPAFLSHTHHPQKYCKGNTDEHYIHCRFRQYVPTGRESTLPALNQAELYQW